MLSFQKGDMMSFLEIVKLKKNLSHGQKTENLCYNFSKTVFKKAPKADNPVIVSFVPATF